MRIQQSAFSITHPLGAFVGIIAFDADHESALTAAQREWGTTATYHALDAGELAKRTHDGFVVFTASASHQG